MALSGMDQTAFDRTKLDRFFEDYVPGSEYEYGSATLSQTDIVGFAQAYDPQPFHVDPEAAADGPFDGLIASGWQTAAVMMRLFADHYLSHPASLGGPGVDELRWLKPVRPGDTLTLRVKILEARPSRSKPDRGLVHTRAELVNQDGDQVFGCVVINILRRRP